MQDESGLIRRLPGAAAVPDEGRGAAGGGRDEAGAAAFGEPLAENARCCLIDHHRPDGVPPGALLITAYMWDPIPNTSLIVYDLCTPLAEIEDLDWIAAIGGGPPSPPSPG